MFHPAPSDPDWFIIDDEEIVKRLAGVPSIRVKRGRWQAHRSHLPTLTNVIESIRHTTPPTADLAARARLDEIHRERGFQLRAHQHSAREFITTRAGILLGDEPRVGKTLSCLASHDPSSGPLLVICPLIAREVWLRWITKMFPGEDVGVMTGKTFDPVTARKPIVVGHYDIVKD